MKVYQLILSFVSFGMLAIPLNAQTVILDPLTNGGDFDTAEGGWTQVGGRGMRTPTATVTNRPAGASERFAAIDHRRDYSYDLGYVVQAGDTFDFSYYWAPSDNLTGVWDWASDNASLFLFTGDSNSFGSATEVYELNSGFAESADQDYNVFELESASGITFGSSVGKNLYIYAQKQTNDENDELFGFDNVSVSVVPEPGSFALLAGMFGLTWVMLRRRS